jgi:hypothetical protein
MQDEHARRCIVLLLNLVEDLQQDNHRLREENQCLRDELNRLKGEQGKPPIKGNTPPPAAPTNYSSERERHTPQAWTKTKKTETLRIDREQVLPVDPAVLPPDAQFKGYEDVVVQDVRFHTDNVRFRKEKYYAPAAGKTYLAPLPPGYDGQFGPGLKALALVLYFGAQMSEPKIVELFRHVGVQISDGQVSNLLIKGHERFHAEKDAVYEAGLRSSPWQEIDDTGTRVNGQNQYCQIVCNPLYTAYVTTESKDRQTILDVLRQGRPRVYRLNAEAEGFLARVGLSQATRRHLAHLPHDETLDEATLLGLLDQHLPDLGPQQRKWILAALGVAAYHAQTEFPVVKLVVCDDAPQFTWVTEALALCWVHEGRHYKKLLPFVAHHRALLDEFLGRFWRYYDQLLAYRQQPTREERARLAARFDELFATMTGYAALDERIAKTRAKKDGLLMVLAHPEIPLHNNPAELAARQRVRKRDVSFGPRTDEGAKAWDTFMTLAATTAKLGLSFYAYIHDRISQANQLPGLDQVLTTQAPHLNLAASWDTS